MSEFYQTLLGKRDNKRAERIKLDAELGQLDEIIKLYEKSHGLEHTTSQALRVRAPKPAPARSGSIKAVVMEILSGRPSGLTTADILAEGGRMGHELNRGTVASLLSVENKNGVLEYDDDDNTYRIKAEAPEAQTPEAPDDDHDDLDDLEIE